MVNFCAVPGCSNRSDRGTNVSYHRLPINKPALLKQWIHKIGRENLPILDSTRVCSEHFINSKGRKLRPDEYPTLKLPLLAAQVSVPPPRRELVRHDLPVKKRKCDSEVETSSDILYCDAQTNTELTWLEIKDMEEELHATKKEIEEYKAEYSILKQKQHLRLSNIQEDDEKVRFYTGFSSYAALMVCFNFLGKGSSKLNYWGSTMFEDKTDKGRKRALLPLEEFFLVLVRLRLGLLEQDLAYRFGVSQSTVSRIINTWINFIYLQLKQIPLWIPRDLTQLNMPRCFKDKYPFTRVIIDATEVYVEQPALPELQQLTFSTYKNTNTYKGLIGISPSGAVVFVSDLYPGCISDKELTRKCGILDLLESGDTLMADRGFDIEGDLILRGVRLNIPPFLKGKQQLSQSELVETRRIASLRIHVERAMERLKNFHIFDKPLPPSFRDTANQTFYICAVLTNFYPPLCT